MEETKTQTAPEGIPVAFFERLPKHVPDFEIAAGMRIVSNGVFVEETLAPKILAAYQTWLSEVSGEAKNQEKLFRRMFGSAEPKLWYALDNKRCLPGMVIPASIPADAKVRIPRYLTSLLDCETYLHPRDPALAKVPGLSATLHPHEGLLLEIAASGKKYVFTESALKQFVQVLRASKTICKKYPNINRPLRDVFAVVAGMVNRARPSTPTEVILVPEQFRGKSGFTLLRSEGFILVQTNENRIVYAYEHKGKGRRDFVMQEVKTLTGKDGQSLLRGFDGRQPRKHSLGRIWSQKMSFHLELRAFEIYFHQISRSRKMKERFNQRPTVRDVLQSFVNAFRQSAPVNELNILAGISRHRRPYAKYRKAANWVFVITEKNIVTSCVQLRALPGQPVEELRDEPESSGQADQQRRHHHRRNRNNNRRRHAHGRRDGQGAGAGERRGPDNRGNRGPGRNGPGRNGPGNQGAGRRGPGHGRSGPGGSGQA